MRGLHLRNRFSARQLIPCHTEHTGIRNHGGHLGQDTNERRMICRLRTSCGTIVMCMVERDAPVVQWIERRPSKPHVAGSNPAGGAIPLFPRQRELPALRKESARGQTPTKRVRTEVRQRADQLWLFSFLLGTLLVVSHPLLTRVLGIAISDLAANIMGGVGIGLLIVSLLTQLRFPRRQRKRQE